MKKKLLFTLWGVLFILCAGFGFISQPEGALKTLMTTLALLFFLPGALLLADARKKGEAGTLTLIRNLSAASLILTAALIIGNFLSVLGGDTLGDALYAVLIVISSPMVCGGNWLVSLFLWACLLIVSADALRKMKTGR